MTRGTFTRVRFSSFLDNSVTDINSFQYAWLFFFFVYSCNITREIFVIKAEWCDHVMLSSLR
jgi:hypothetical protein